MKLNEKEIEEVAGKILSSVRDKIVKQIANEFYDHYREFLYEHYQNYKSKIESELIKEFSDEFIKEPERYKYFELRKKLYEENKDTIDKALIKDVIEEGVGNTLRINTDSNFYFNYQWKEAVCRAILNNWDKFKDDERVKIFFGNALENRQVRIKELEDEIKKLIEFKQNNCGGKQTPVGIKEVYEKFKHLDIMLSDKEWMTPDSTMVSPAYTICYELWRVIKNECA